MQSLVTLLGNLDLPRLRRKTILLVTPLPSQYGFIVDTPHRHQACTTFPSTMTRFGPFSVDLITTLDKTQFHLLESSTIPIRRFEQPSSRSLPALRGPNDSHRSSQ